MFIKIYKPILFNQIDVYLDLTRKSYWWYSMNYLRAAARMRPQNNWKKKIENKIEQIELDHMVL